VVVAAHVVVAARMVAVVMAAAGHMAEDKYFK
jgi:hypothetical protein